MMPFVMPKLLNPIIPVLCRTCRKILRLREAQCRKTHTSLLSGLKEQVQQELPERSELPELLELPERLELPELPERLEVPAVEAVHTAAAVLRIAAAAAAHIAVPAYRKPGRTPTRTAQYCRILGRAYRRVSRRPRQPA